MNRLVDEYMNIMAEDGGGTGGDPENPGEEDEPDTTPPSISLQTSSTENTITVTVIATDESGLAENETYIYYIDNLQQGVATTESTKTYTGLQPSTEYTIKVEVKDKFGNIGQEEIKVSTTEPEVPDMGDAKPNPDQDGPEYGTNTPIQDDKGNTVVIPGGFHLDEDSGTSVEEGIVIEDSNGNQFVWIPTGTYQTSSGAKTNNLSRRTFTSSGATEVIGDSSIKGDGSESFHGEGNRRSCTINNGVNSIDAFKKSVNENKGFYIGRYEQGTGNVCRLGVSPYTDITRFTAQNQAKAMYEGNINVVSELMSSYAWDTALNYICQTNSLGYTLATTSNNSYANIGTGTRYNTGEYAADNYSKIHDLLGNCWEWTTEYCDMNFNPSVTRGGAYAYNLSDSTAELRHETDGNSSDSYYSFRVQMYVK